MRFHSFEVGFGRAGKRKKLRKRHSSFHSFEVGFGQDVLMKNLRAAAGFHSFEVGFGPDIRNINAYEFVVFIPSR